MGRKSKRKKKHFGYVFITLFIGVAVFLAATFLIKPPTPCANSATCKSDLTLQVDNTAVGTFQGRRVTPPKIDLAMDMFKSSVLGTTVARGEKHIYVNLDTQRLYAYQGTTKVMETLISSGKWQKTPVGNFHIWSKLRATRMAGGEGADAYNLPNVPYVMYFFNDFGLHGAYWHNNFGHTMSHGCVNMRLVDAAQLFAWADGPTKGNPGTPVSICNQFSPPNLCIQVNPVK